MADCTAPPCATLAINTTCEPRAGRPLPYDHDLSQPDCSPLFCKPPDCRWCRCKACAACIGTASLHTAASPPADHLVVLAASTADAARAAAATWLSWAPRPFVVIDKTNAPNLGLDSSTYLWFILRHYDRLPKWVCFLHLHEYHWHHPYYSQLKSMAVDVARAGVGFLNLAHDSSGAMVVYEKAALRELNDTEHRALREELLGIPRRHALRENGTLRFAPGGQFWVSRQRILARPRRFYAKLYEAVTDPHHPLLGRTSTVQLYHGRKIGVFFMEAYWHFIMGEPLWDFELAYTKYAELPAVSWRTNPAWSGKRLEAGYTCDNPYDWARRAASLHTNGLCQARVLPFEGA